MAAVVGRESETNETMAYVLSLCAPAPKFSHNRTPIDVPSSRTHLSFLTHAFSSLSVSSRKSCGSSFTPKSTAEAPVMEFEAEDSVPESEPTFEESEPQREEVFAVVMVGSRQYIVFPGRYIYTQRLKGANVNDKITLNKVLLVGTKTSTYIGKPIVPNATVQAIVEEQTLDKKVVVFKYKKKKNYRRNIGHRQPITRIRITNITGYQDSPAVTLEEISR